jgi:hypothetical protein
MLKIQIMKRIIYLIIVVILLCSVGFVSYNIGGHSASLQVKKATPMQLAEAMQGDHFYSDYPRTMLLLNGKVSSVSKRKQDTIIGFQVTKKPNVLPKVTCEFSGAVSVKKGETIRVLTVAYDAQRQHIADVALQNCYLIKN